LINQDFNIDNSKVFIDPSCNVYYSSYYIKGLKTVYGKENVSFSARYFISLKLKQESSAFDHYMAFVVINKGYHPLKIIIDFRDKASVKDNAFQWSDIYAKINFNLSQTDKKYHKKITSIPPAFGIKIWNIWETAYFCIVNYIRSRPIVSLKSYLTNYGAQYNRPYLDDFLRGESDDEPEETKPYVFFNSRLWAHSVEETNLQRN